MTRQSGALYDDIMGWQREGAAAGLTLYLALDAVWAEDLAARVRSSRDGWLPLTGISAQPPGDSHPRDPLLIDLTGASDIVMSWIDQCFDARIGVVLASPLPLFDLRRSLRRFGQVIAGDAPEPVTLRYFDARVMACFLAAGYPAMWADFLDGVHSVILPHPEAHSWTMFKFRDGKLRQGIQTAGPGGGMVWAPLPTRAWDDLLDYRTTFPFRRLSPAQMRRIDACVARGVHHEICTFLRRAFPAETAPATDAELMDLVAEAEEVAQAQGAGEESAVFLWAILSFMDGLDFHIAEPANTTLRGPGPDMETRLEQMVFNAGALLGNRHLIRLTDNLEVWTEMEDGSVSGQAVRSGRVLIQPDGS